MGKYICIPFLFLICLTASWFFFQQTFQRQAVSFAFAPAPSSPPYLMTLSEAECQTREKALSTLLCFICSPSKSDTRCWAGKEEGISAVVFRGPDVMEAERGARWREEAHMMSKGSMGERRHMCFGKQHSSWNPSVLCWMASRWSVVFLQGLCYVTWTHSTGDRAIAASEWPVTGSGPEAETRTGFLLVPLSQLCQAVKKIHSWHRNFTQKMLCLGHMFMHSFIFHPRKRCCQASGRNGASTGNKGQV